MPRPPSDAKLESRFQLAFDIKRNIEEEAPVSVPLKVGRPTFLVSGFGPEIPYKVARKGDLTFQGSFLAFADPIVRAYISSSLP